MSLLLPGRRRDGGSPSSPKAVGLGLAAAAAVALFGLTKMGGAPHALSHSSLRGVASALKPALSGAACTFAEYTPSPWEEEWMADADAIAAQDSQCATMRSAAPLSAQWLAGVAACREEGGYAASPPPPAVFSRFLKRCSTGEAVEEFIEPLVGHMRHPYSVAGCEPAAVPPAIIEDRSYIMLLGSDPAAVRARYPGRAILVDAGTNKYRTSLGWLVPNYAALGIHFDAIYAWEATRHNATYWDAVPADVKPRLHFYNAPVTAEPGSPMNPVDWIKALHRPGDYVVFKLDIDHDDTESAFIDQILATPNAGDLISEMFFEKHYRAADMERHFGRPSTEYPAALRLMQSLRAHGVRAHFWP